MEVTTMMEIMTSLSLPPGIGFHPTDAELIYHYLKRKIIGVKSPLEIIQELDIYKYEPWDLPGKSLLPSRDCKWHFFTPRDRKYPNGGRINRATEAGYWKATGKDRDISHQKRIIGTKKTLVFHKGRAPAGDRTDWIMHEYHINRNECEAAPGMHDAFVLCRITKKNGLTSQDDETIEAQPESSDQTSVAAAPVNFQNDSPRMEGLLEKIPTTSEIRDEGLQKTLIVPSMISTGLTCDGLQSVPTLVINSGIAPPLSDLKSEPLMGFPDFRYPKSYLEDAYTFNYQDFPELDLLQLPDDFLLSGFNFSDVLRYSDTYHNFNTQNTAEHKIVEELFSIATEASTSQSNVKEAPSPPDLTAQVNMEENMRTWDATNPKHFGSIYVNEAGFEAGTLFDSRETRIQRHIRSEKSQIGESSQHKISLQVNKMQSRAPRPVETYTFDQNVQIVQNACNTDLDSDNPKQLMHFACYTDLGYDLQEQSVRLENTNKQYYDETNNVLVLEETTNAFSDLDHNRTGTRVKPKSEKSFKDSHSIPQKPAIIFEAPGLNKLASLPESGEYSGKFSGDSEQHDQGFFRCAYTFLQQCSSTGSSYLFSAGCILGSASLMFYFPLRAAWRSLKIFSWMSS